MPPRSRGTRILGLVQEYDTLITQGHSVDVAVQLGMVIMQDVRTHQGTLLVPRGFEVTSLFLERIGNFGPGLLSEIVKVMVPAAKSVASG
jgi:hypothetical protein